MNKISHGEFRDADFPVDWRTNLRVAKIDLGLLEQCLRLQNVGLGALLRGCELIDCCLRHCLALDQRLIALQLQIRVDFVCFGLGEICRLLVDRRLVGVLLDPEEQFTFLHDLSFREVALFDEPGHARDDFDSLNRHYASNVRTCVGHRAIHDRFHSDCWRWRALRVGRPFRTDHRENRNQDCPEACVTVASHDHAKPLLTAKSPGRLIVRIANIISSWTLGP